MVRTLMLIGVVTSVAACGGGGSDAGDSTSQPPHAPPAVSTPANTSASRPFPHSDLQVADLIYADTRTPADFYTEHTRSGASYVATTHLKQRDLDASAPRRELCTDDWNEALSWSETVTTGRATYADLVATHSEPRFFEFERVPREAPSALLRQRVFKCAYLDRSSAEPETLAGSGGRFNRRPATAQQLRELTEYLWHFTPFNNFGNAVLASAPSGTSGHAIVIATLTRASAQQNCDRIDVVRWTHTLEGATGAITRTLTALATLHAREGQGVVTLCEAP